MTEYYDKIRRVLLIVLISNLIIGLAKVLYGINTNVLSITADGYDSLLDALTNIIGIIAVYISGKPYDAEHRYGHTKVETFASILISATLFIVAYEIITTAIDRFFNHIVPSISISTYSVLIITLIITVVISRYEKKMGEKYNSNLLISDSEHIKSDALATGIIILSLIFIQNGLTILDPILSILISLMIMKTGASILKTNLDILLDINIIDCDIIKDELKFIYGVNNIHNVRTRGTNSAVYVDMHLVVDDNLTIEQAHQISKSCKNTLYKKHPEIKDILIQLEPNSGLYDEINYKHL
ncbi:cation diffusion facilitator family transporter [Methanosphaera sp. ISO3-F5]|uniref:cation diffusion facilitator family transporter n=1 Tax=Methanosphaera sp. ISO3-F5 TaxID=1452353 RepID=UPI002B25BD00|nr:cation diffusion facilitator family transporter [Methanosphaera sp. ISO3-F5]WQH63839.1 cation diffusion facilitator family transporter [Methanosphaera sp. ISO3-F5]